MIVGHKGRITCWTYEAAYCLPGVYSDEAQAEFIQAMGYEGKEGFLGSTAAPSDVMVDPLPAGMHAPPF